MSSPKLKTRYVVQYNNLPARMPLWPTVVAILALDRVQAPGWVWGAIGMIFLVVWIGWAVDVWKTEPVDITDDLKEVADKLMRLR